MNIGPHEHCILDAGLTRGTFSFHGATRDVYRGGDGPPIILLPELPGITPETVTLCERLMRAGYSVVLPSLFGEPGKPIVPQAALQVFQNVCVSREFSVLAGRKESPISDWLRALARFEHKKHGGPGVGVIGMCFTGGFALAMMLDESVIAPVLSVPASRAVGRHRSRARARPGRARAREAALPGRAPVRDRPALQRRPHVSQAALRAPAP